MVTPASNVAQVFLNRPGGVLGGPPRSGPPRSGASVVVPTVGSLVVTGLLVTYFLGISIEMSCKWSEYK